MTGREFVLSKTFHHDSNNTQTCIYQNRESAFVPGRAITDNIRISTEIVYYLKRKKQGKVGVVALKIDMSKAYDHVEWNFLKFMMLRMGFAEEGLSSLIRNRERAGLIHRVKVARSTPAVSHLFFADDCLLFFKPNHTEARIMKSLLAVYGVASGQQVNYNKSVLSFSANVDEASLRQGGEGNYAENSSPSNSELCHEYLFVTSKELEIMMNSFWWGNNRQGGQGIRWLRWDLLCKPKSVGGIGFKRIHDFNIAMLGKQCWKLMTHPHSLVARIFKARYYPRSSFTDATVGFNRRYTWRLIMAAKHVVVKGSRIQIGSGQQIQINKDPWLPDADNRFITTVLDDSLATTMVNSLMVPGQRQWDNDLVANIFNTRDAALILQVPLSTRQDDDRWFWLADTKGKFTVRSCYNVLNSALNSSNTKVWKFLWGLEVPGKVKHFIWRALINVLPTADSLLSRKVDVSLICPICSVANESVYHCLVECLFAQSCWLLSSLGTGRRCSSFVDWIEQIFIKCRKEECTLAVMVCWKLWLNRNDKVWNGHNGRAKSLVNAAGHYLFQWQEAKRKNFIIIKQVQLGHGSVCWGKAPLGWLKCNVDAGVFSSQGRYNFGGVIRDSGGCFVAAKCQSFSGLFRPPEAEALAVREALSWIKNLQLPKVIIEIDCLSVYSALVSHDYSPNGFGLIIADCQALAQLVGEVRFSFVRRSANVTAHNVARVGGSISGLGDWRDVPPPWLCPMLTVSYD
ncbi:putative reverse transcriptase/RNA-dependent DNA polymerase [Citrus sinensis]|nr:putative reverse transcriptase/RNA-dependent DNA polymerase [Citrus sinensis]